MQQPQIKPKRGRPPANPLEGAAKTYTVRLTDAQARRAMMFGATVSQGINALLRDVAPEVK